MDSLVFFTVVIRTVFFYSGECKIVSNQLRALYPQLHCTALSRSPKGNNAVWVIVDRLTKSAHFIPFRLGQSTELLADNYLQEVV